jgi:hypothetical protein
VKYEAASNTDGQVRAESSRKSGEGLSGVRRSLAEFAFYILYLSFLNTVRTQDCVEILIALAIKHRRSITGQPLKRRVCELVVIASNGSMRSSLRLAQPRSFYVRTQTGLGPIQSGDYSVEYPRGTGLWLGPQKKAESNWAHGTSWSTDRQLNAGDICSGNPASPMLNVRC